MICAPAFNAFTGGFKHHFLLETSEELRVGPLRHRKMPTDEPIQNGQPIDPTLLCLSFFLAEISMLKIS